MRHFTTTLGLGVLCVAAASSLSSAALTQSQAFNGSPAVFNNGAGSGFGGAINNPASISFNVVSGNLVVKLTPNFALTDNLVALWLDTAPGGFTDAQMGDTGDGGRRVLSNPIANGNLNFPGNGTAADNTILPEYGVSFGGFGAVSFQLTAAGAPFNLNFLTFNDTNPDNSRSLNIPLASLGNPSVINFFSAYVSDSGYSSNESLPGGSLQDTGNPGFGDGQFGGAPAPTAGFGINNYNQFSIPEPASLSLLGLPALMLARRARRN